MLVNFSFDYWSMNPSVQVGDNFYSTDPNNLKPKGGFDVANSFPHFIGKIFSINYDIENSMVILQVLISDENMINEDLLHRPNVYFSFSKNSEVNQNELLGYYEEVKFVNNSRRKVELFSVGTGATESSK